MLCVLTSHLMMTANFLLYTLLLDMLLLWSLEVQERQSRGHAPRFDSVRLLNDMRIKSD